jgi:hypothetical protein
MPDMPHALANYLIELELELKLDLGLILITTVEAGPASMGATEGFTVRCFWSRAQQYQPNRARRLR